MSVEQIKDEIRDLSAAELDQVAAFILQLRRSTDLDRKRELAEMIDDPEVTQWKHLDSQ